MWKVLKQSGFPQSHKILRSNPVKRKTLGSTYASSIYVQICISGSCLHVYMSALQSRNAVCANIKHINRYFHSHGKRLCGHMCLIWHMLCLNNIDHLVISSGTSKVKESSVHVIWNAHTAFLPCGADVWAITFDVDTIYLCTKKKKAAMQDYI